MNIQLFCENGLQFAQRIKQDDASAFEEAFKEYYRPLVNFARGFFKDDSLAEEHVQEVFVVLWEKRYSLPQNLNLFLYLLKAVRNKCINTINHSKVKQKYLSQTQREYQVQILNYDCDDLTEDLIKELHNAVNQLPEKCREVFELSKFENLSHKEIALKLNISTKTVENQITKAFKLLRNEMLKHVHIFLGCIGVLIH